VLSESLRAAPGNPITASFVEDSQCTWYLPAVRGPLLAFDIETTGLREHDSVTCVCAYDPDRCVEFRRSTPDGEVCEEFLALLDEAPLLCAFNGVRFDIPFLAKRWNVPPERAAAWARKLVDPFEACKLALKRTFSLDSLLEANGLDCKTGSGAEAVEMARQGRWQELEEYCMNDTKKTHEAAVLPRVRVPAQRSFGCAAQLKKKATDAQRSFGCAAQLKKKQ
jgi:hypothetical protein